MALEEYKKILQSKEHLSIVNVKNVLFPHHTTTGKRALSLRQGQASCKGTLVHGASMKGITNKGEQIHAVNL